MRIVENSASHLKLRETSTRLSAFLAVVAAIFTISVVVRHSDPRQLINAGLFAASALFFRRISRTDLDKSARRCRIFRLDMWRRSDRTVPFDDIDDVQVELMQPDTSVQCHTRLSLVTSAGPIPLTAGFIADLDGHIAIREVMVDVIFNGRSRPPPLDPGQLLRDGGRPIAASMRA